MLYPFANYTAARLKSALLRQSAADSAILTQLIDAGRGHERSSEICGKADALSVAYAALTEQSRKLQEEKQRRARFHGGMKPLPEAHRQSFLAA